MLFTRKKGQYQQLTSDQIRRLRRTNEVNLLLEHSKKATITLTIMAAWLAHLDREGKKLSQKDLIAASLPNRQKLMAIASDLAATSAKVRGM